MSDSPEAQRERSKAYRVGKVVGKRVLSNGREHWYSLFRGQFDSIYKNSRYAYHLIQKVPLLELYLIEILAHVHKDICTRYSLQIPKLDAT